MDWKDGTPEPNTTSILGKAMSFASQPSHPPLGNNLPNTVSLMISHPLPQRSLDKVEDNNSSDFDPVPKHTNGTKSNVPKPAMNSEYEW